MRRAGDGRECRRDVRERAALAEFADARRVIADERFRETNHVDDGQPVHNGIAAEKRGRRKGILMMAPSLKLMNGFNDFRRIHRVDFRAASDFDQ